MDGILLKNMEKVVRFSTLCDLDNSVLNFNLLMYDESTAKVHFLSQITHLVLHGFSHFRFSSVMMY